MGRKVLRELVPSRAIRTRDEIKVLGLRRRERGAQRGGARIGYRTGRKTGVLIGVVRVGASEIGLIDLAAKAAFEQGGVYGSGVAIELHSPIQTIVEHGPDQRPVGGHRSFLFDEGCQGDDLVNVARCSELRPFSPETLGEGSAKLPRTGVAG